MKKNYFYLVNPNWNEENFVLAKRNDADLCCKELYDDLADVILKQRILPNGNLIEIYEMSKYVDSETGGYFETRINIKKDNKILYKIGLGSDYIGASIYWAVKAGCSQNDCLNILKTSRTLGGHIYSPRWIIDNINNTFIHGISMNKAKAGKKGFYDRIDLFLNDLSSWYRGNNCKLETIFMKNKIWLKQFNNIDGFVEFFKLESFKKPITKEFIDFTNEDSCLFNEMIYIPDEVKEYKLFASRINAAIEKRNLKLNCISLNN